MYLGRIVELATAGELFAAPRHPYARALLDAVPRLDAIERRTAAPIEGEPPSAAHLPRGCVFSGRCPHVEAACREGEPELRTEDGRAVVCRRWRDTLPSPRPDLMEFTIEFLNRNYANRNQQLQ